nr:SDR family oxidoreductase [Propionibacteriales bacterium]
RQPVPRWGTPDDVADAVAYLMSTGAGFVSGQRLVVNGGFHFS